MVFKAKLKPKIDLFKIIFNCPILGPKICTIFYFSRGLILQKMRLCAYKGIVSEPIKAIGDGDQCSPRHPTLLNANIYPVVAPTIKQPNKPVSPSYSRDKYGQMTDDKSSKRLAANILPRVPS